MPTRTQQCDVISCAYASHGDTKHVLLFPEDPRECFEFGAQAFDLADRLQTPVFVLLDLDIGMNERLCQPLAWNDAKPFDRGKVMTAADLEAGKEFGRYLDVDGDGIPYRTYPGTHPTRGSFFTRGTSRDRYARYTEDGAAYADNMQRLLKKFETAKKLVPGPVRRDAKSPARHGVLYYGSTTPAVAEGPHPLPAPRPPPGPPPLPPLPLPAHILALLADHPRLTPEPHRHPARSRQRHAVPKDRVMTYLAKPKLHHPKLPTNKLGYTRRDYEGSVSTLCAGCGHDSISAAIIQACFNLDLPPHRIAKPSGIGCSSKTPTYFLGNSHGFNSVHRRMPSVLTGANLANNDLIYLGVSGDGDSASIRLGQFAHCLRLRVNMVYLVENNR